MICQMKLPPEIFERIKNGKKIIELRLYDQKRQLIKLGGKIEFLKRPDLAEKISVEVVGLLVYEKFVDLIEDLPASYFGYNESEKEDLKKSMYAHYTKEQEAEHGVLGIKMKLL
ncbi:hypothetical protein KAJ41_02805 [Candidatus Parcubacteria bacterium]|nr:hypothetical protein [Candidatus Parcubacteria bacterium]